MLDCCIFLCRVVRNIGQNFKATSHANSAYNHLLVFPTAAAQGNTRLLWRRLSTELQIVLETQGAGGNARASRAWKGNEEFDDPWHDGLMVGFRTA